MTSNLFFRSGLLSLLLVLPVVAQQVTDEQLAIFESLSPDQQQALIEAMQSDERGGIRTGSSRRNGISSDARSPLTGRDSAEVVELQRQLDELLEEPRIQGRDTLVIEAEFPEDVDPGAEAEFMADINRVRLLGSNTWITDKLGVLNLPGIANVPLAGLDSAQVTLRLSSEPLLAPLNISVTILPVEPSGPDALKPFGYDIFDSSESDFRTDPLAPVPVPSDYVLGPGDILNVQLYGRENREFELLVNDDGTVNFPQLGPRSVAGLTFSQLQEIFDEQVSEQLIGTQASVTIAEVRAIRVFVVGDARRPGAYTLSGLSRVTAALFASGGITEIGSLRKIELRRGGQLVRRIDLYDLLLSGKSGADLQLEPEDVVFIPPVDDVVTIDGDVRRPAIYELRNERTIIDVLELAGGLLPSADASLVTLERILGDGRRRVETLDLRSADGQVFAVRPGDALSVFSVAEELDDAVYLSGHVEREGSFEWSPGMRITDLLPSAGLLKARADLNYLLIRRERGDDRQVQVLSVDLARALVEPQGSANPRLENRDRVFVFELGVARGAAMASLIEELRTQATKNAPLQVVRVTGQVRAPGRYPLESGMRVSDLLRAGGGLGANAYATEAELARFVATASGPRRTELLRVDLDRVLAGEESADITLRPYDYLSVKEVPSWGDQIEVELAGEFVFPGTYPVTRGETLRNLIDRAGGLTDLAFPQGSVFTRTNLAEREAEQLELLANRLESDLTALALQAASASGSAGAQRALSIGQSLLTQLREAEATGRLVIDLPSMLNGRSIADVDIVMRDGDKLVIPPRSQEITVLGEVQYPTSHLFRSGVSRDSYISLSGGLTNNAEKKRIYIVRANGAVVAENGSRWFGAGTRRIKPGDTIVVPLDTTRIPSLQQWSSVTQIIYNLAIAVAAVNSF